RAVVTVAAPAVAGAPPTSTPLRFRVVATAPTTTTIRIESLAATDTAGRPLVVTAPGALSVSIVAAQAR
ncbi:MAG: hypothetical protein ACREVP_03445, partial [Burkholderiales bacterium]